MKKIKEYSVKSNKFKKKEISQLKSAIKKDIDWGLETIEKFEKR